MHTKPDDFRSLDLAAQLAHVNTVERDINLLRAAAAPHLDRLPITTLEEWALVDPPCRYRHLLDLEVERGNLREYLQGFLRGRKECAA